MFEQLMSKIRLGACWLALSAVGSAAYADGLAGPYLAAVQASYRNDYASAAKFFNDAVSQDTENTYLLQNAVLNNVIAGSFDTAVPLARQLSQLTTDRQIAGLILVADHIAKQEYGAATELLQDDSFGFNSLLKGLLKGWVSAGLGEISKAQEHFDLVASETNFGSIGEYHKGLVLALAGDFEGSNRILSGSNGEPLHVSRAALIAHIQVLLQLERREEAIQHIETAGGDNDRELSKLKAAIGSGEVIQFDQLSDPNDGAAEVFLTLATALSRENAEVFALLYARLSQRIRPNYVEALLLSADILSDQEQNELAVADYEKIPETSGVYRDAEIGRANALVAQEKIEEAVGALTQLSQEFPQDAYIHMSLGDTFRREERYAEAATSYTNAIDLTGELSAADWRNFYVRGICYERTDQWDAAEADFRQALELQPDQPLVLNYLGYSLVEMNLKIDEARDMIERAVSGDPDNGYITDSLGWVLYRIGQYEDAVPHMERAVELLPSDPVINDHLGDVLWKVGRKTEAVFQWKRALSFEPDEEADPDRIRRKLEVGLDVVLEEESETQN